MKDLAHDSAPAASVLSHGARFASLPDSRAFATIACAAVSSLSASTGSTRCASLRVKAGPAGALCGPCLVSGGNENETLGASVTPSSTRTLASYSALVRRRIRAGSEELEAAA